MDDGTADVFVHQSEIHSRSYRTLSAGETLEFEVYIRNDGRRAARNVTGPNGSYVRGASYSSALKAGLDAKLQTNASNTSNTSNFDTRQYTRKSSRADDEQKFSNEPYEPKSPNDPNANARAPRTLSKKDLSYVAAVCIVPPESIWAPIEEIRMHHDKAYKRWMPHINILFPFIGEKLFASQVDKLRQEFARMSSFEVHLNKFGYFRRRGNKKDPNPKQSVYLQPSDKKNSRKGSVNETEESLQEIYRILVSVYPMCEIRNEFHGHLSVGQWTLDEVDGVIKDMNKKWKPVSFVCDHICLVARSNDANSRMQVIYKVPLAGDNSSLQGGYFRGAAFQDW